MSKRWFKIFLTVFVILPVMLISQAPQDDGFQIEPLQLPSLQALIDSAKVKSPLLKKYEAEAAVESFNLTFEQRKWMDFIYMEGNVRYGVYDQVYVQGEVDGLDPIYPLFNERKQTWYYGGISLKLPLSTFINQNKKIKQTKMTIEAIGFEREMMAEELEKIIIESYYKVLFRHESMNTFYTIYQDLKIAYLDAVNRLNEQKINFQDYAILSSTYGKAKNDFDQAKSDFLTSLNLLRFMTGWNF